MHSHASPASAGNAGSALPETSGRIVTISLGVTVCLLALKLAVGIISGSVAVLGDAVDSATDLVGGLAALISVRIAATPADEMHPYGHGKVEAISASVAATIIGVGGGLITYQAVRRLIEGSPDIDIGIGLGAMIVAAVANLIVAFYMRREAARSGSMALRAEATHLHTNVIQALAIITGLALVGITDEPAFDAITALLLAAYMGWTAIGLARIALEEMLDRSLPDVDIREIEAVMLAHASEVRGFHQLRTRRAGPTREVDVHVTFDPHRDIAEVHETCDRIAAEVRERLPGATVLIHPEPDPHHTDAPG
ncbi:MAG TPA: cation diffusion facilitator family transporter [Dehalococcoidia bacterium]|nr:cation diffusion facilitator family transporter [Dehalococcoidia bacterium]